LVSSPWTIIITTIILAPRIWASFFIVGLLGRSDKKSAALVLSTYAEALKTSTRPLAAIDTLIGQSFHLEFEVGNRKSRIAWLMAKRCRFRASTINSNLPVGFLRTVF
jgi:hypothetical protein